MRIVEIVKKFKEKLGFPPFKPSRKTAKHFRDITSGKIKLKRKRRK